MDGMRDSFFSIAWFVCAIAIPAATAGEGVDFVRQIQPILSDRCFTCHGPDAGARQADMRLDLREQAIQVAIQPGNAAASALVRRITSDDPDERMPPVDSNKSPITQAEADLIRRWIDQGAEYSTHWSFEKPVRPDPPAETDAVDTGNPIDAFIRRRLQREGLVPSPPAGPRTLIRRLSFDLTGLPPSPEEVRAFQNDSSPQAYESLVDRLLDSPHYGERMASYWLDLVRYADTDGIHSDEHRDHASYRDYVIKAFNDNLPYDRFVVEQLAGDLLPESTEQQLIASGFNRLNMTTKEGGAQAREYTAIYSADRVRNTATIFLGVTLGCAQCHAHKFDPFTMKDFYSFASFFADVEETPVGDQKTVKLSRIAHNEQERAQIHALRAKIETVQTQLDTHTPELERAQEQWEVQARKQAMRTPRIDTWSAVGPFAAEAADAAFRMAFLDETRPHLDREKTYRDGALAWKEQPDWEDGKIHQLTGNHAATYLVRTIHAYSDHALELSLGSDDAIKVWLNGQLMLEEEVYRSVAEDQNRVAIQLKQGDNQLLVKIVNRSGISAFYFKALGDSPISGLEDILRVSADERDEAQQQKLAAHFRGIAPGLTPAREIMEALQAEAATLNAEMQTLVSRSIEPRMVRILPRGNWLDDSGEVVQPAPPSFLGDWTVAGRRATRKDLADWIVSPDNPLSARVFVNRVWKLAFGHGLGRSLDDFGAQGRRPSHPELLDWLATTFIDKGWDIKHTMKLVVMSSTYRQSSRVAAPLAAKDPDNELYARQSRFRLEAEMVRDNALVISGLLVRRLGGPSVKPYQPAGYWAHMNFPVRTWQHDEGENLYRRSLYTYWCRTFLHPGLAAFDAPSREECTVQRPRSNTPSAALVLLNDPTFVEAARSLAALILRDGGSDIESRVHYAFDRVLNRAPEATEIQILTNLVEKHLAAYQGDAQSAAATQSVGAIPPVADLDAAELAAWTSAARTMLNLHETITRN